MRHTRRLVLNAMTVLSLMLLLGVAASWIDSYLAATTTGNYGAGQDIGDSTPIYVFRGPQMISFKGRLHLIEAGDTISISPTPRSFERYKRPGADKAAIPDPSWDYWGFQFTWSPTIWTVIPHWFLVLLFSLLPTVWIVRRCRRFAFPDHPHCQNCGYDLYGVRDPRCPECGEGVCGVKEPSNRLALFYLLCIVLYGASTPPRGRGPSSPNSRRRCLTRRTHDSLADNAWATARVPRPASVTVNIRCRRSIE